MKMNMKVGFAALALLGGMGIALPSMAQTKLTVGYQPTLDVLPVLVAREEGFFAKRGLDVDVQSGTGAVQIAGTMANSLQIGDPTVPQVLQAVDSGLDLVIVAGANLMAPEADEFKVVTRTGLALSKPADFIGKKVGVNTIGAFLDVLFKAWLARGGVDLKQVTFVEVGFPSMNDVLHQGTVDAVVTVEPFASRIVAAGNGTASDDFLRDFPSGMPVAIYAARRDWVEANRPTVEAFRAAMQDAIDFAAKNDEKAREDTNKYLKIPPQVMAHLKMPVLAVDVPQAGVAEWIKILKAQGLVGSNLDAARILQR